MEQPSLSLFGPFDHGGVYGFRAGVIGTVDGIQRFERWVRSVQAPLSDAQSDAEAMFRPLFPGFETAFGIPWSPTPKLRISVDPIELSKCLHIADRHQRVYKTVDLFAKNIVGAKRNEEQQVDVWFVVIPDDVHKYCRPKSVVEASLRQREDVAVSRSEARRFFNEPSLFPALNECQRDAYLWTVGFIPRLQTYIGKEVPNPIFVEICRGQASIVRVLSDVLALTKLNYNSCLFGDGEPVTLKFADAVGEILTAAPLAPVIVQTDCFFQSEL